MHQAISRLLEYESAHAHLVPRRTEVCRLKALCRGGHHGVRGEGGGTEEGIRLKPTVFAYIGSSLHPPQLDIYDRQPYPPEVRYEVVQLPLQGYVSLARQEVQAGWWAVQTRWQRLQCSLKELVTKARTQTQGNLLCEQQLVGH